MAVKQIQSVDKYLYKPEIGGYCLNSNYQDLKADMGRLFGFAYGHKENGAVFSHMAMMYANALYKNGFVDAGDKVISTIYEHINNIEVSQIYPGIPEYFNDQGRGMYHYLTGSASWLVLTFVTEVFGIKGYYGDIILEPKLKKYQFYNKQASICKMINNNLVKITYINELELDYNQYQITKVIIDEEEVSFYNDKKVLLTKKPKHRIDVILGKK